MSSISYSRIHGYGGKDALGVQQEDGKPVVALSVRKNSGDPQQSRRVASAPLPAAAGKPVYLKLSVNGGVLSASYALRSNAWQPLATKQAGGFVGTVIGLYNEEGK